jgi:uncharacterized protein (DUF58 family)
MAAVSPGSTVAGPRARVKAWMAARRAAMRARATARDAGEVELTQRRVYILPTRAGLGFAGLLLALLVGAINYTLGLGFGLTFIAGACAIVDMVATTRNLARLRLAAGRTDAVFAGEDAPFELRLANPTRLARYAVRLDLDHVREPRHAVDLGPGDARTVVVHAPTVRRGWLPAPRIRLSTSFPLGLFRAWAYWQPDSRVLVYPFPETAAPPLPLSGQASADGTGSAGGDDFAGVRSYQSGDALRHLAWRQIARLDLAEGGQLVTKHFEGGTFDELVLDFAALPAGLDVELRLSRLTRWVVEAEGRALPYALRLGAVRYDAALGPAHQAACLRALALYGIGTP